MSVAKPVIGILAAAAATMAVVEHLRERGAKEEQQADDKRLAERIEQYQENLRKGTAPQGTAYFMNEKKKTRLLGKALQSLFTKLEKQEKKSAALPLEAKIPYLCVTTNYTAPAVVVFAAALLVGDEDLVARLFYPWSRDCYDDEEEALREKLKTGLAVGSALGSISGSGLKALIDFCDALTEVPLLPGHSARLSECGDEERPLIQLCSVVRSLLAENEIPFKVRQLKGNSQEADVTLRIAQSLSLGCCRQSALGTPTIGAIRASVAQGPAPICLFKSVAGNKRGERGDDGALFLSTFGSPQLGFKVPISDFRETAEGVTYMPEFGKATPLNARQRDCARDAPEARAHFVAAVELGYLGMAAGRRLRLIVAPDDTERLSLEHVVALRGGSLDFVEWAAPIRDMRKSDAELLRLRRDDALAALSRVLETIVPEEDDEEEEGGDRDAEISRFTARYYDLLRIRLCEVPRFRGEPPSASVPELSIEGAALESLGYVPSPPVFKRLRRALLKEERVREREAQVHGLAAPPASFRVSAGLLLAVVSCAMFYTTFYVCRLFVLYYLLGPVGLPTWLDSFVAWPASVALFAWNAHTVVAFARAKLRCDKKVPLSKVYARFLWITYDLLANLRKKPLLLEKRANTLDVECRYIAQIWNRRRQRRAFRDHLRRGKITAAEAIMLLMNISHCRPPARKNKRRRATTSQPSMRENYPWLPKDDDDDDEEDPLYEYMNDADDGVQRGVLPGTLEECEAFLELEVVEEEAESSTPALPPSEAFAEALGDVVSGRRPQKMLEWQWQWRAPEEDDGACSSEEEEEEAAPERKKKKKKLTIGKRLHEEGFRMIRQKNHMVFEREVSVGDGETFRQKIVLSSTPSDHRTERNQHATLNRLNGQLEDRRADPAALGSYKKRGAKKRRGR